MILKIAKEYNPAFDTDVMTIKYNMLEEMGAHLFVASHKWDKVIVELHPLVKAETLHYIPTVTDVIQITYEGHLEDYMKCLTELFPSKSGAIRRAVMQKAELLPVLGEDVLWKAS